MKKYLILLCLTLIYSCDSLNKVTTTQDLAPGITGNAQSLTRITSDRIPEFYPNTSRDGKKIIFHTRDDNKIGTDKWGIVMVELGQTGRIPLVGSNTMAPSFYPDSKTIAYTYMKPTKPVIARGMTDGSAGINYISNSTMGDFDSYPKVSPDGKKIVFQTKFGGSYSICMMDINGMNTTILTEGLLPSWNDKSNQIVYHNTVGKFNQIFVYDIATGQSTQLTSGEFNNDSASYSFNGENIVFASTRDNDNEHIFVMKKNGSNITQVTTGKSRNGMPCFGLDNKIFFSSNAGTKQSKVEWSESDIWSVNVVLQ